MSEPLLDRLAAHRTLASVPRPQLEWLDELILRSALGRSPTDVFYVFNPLWQMDEKEKADIGEKKARTAKTWSESGLVPDQVLVTMVQNQIIEDALYPGSEAAYEAAAGEGEGGEASQAPILADPNFRNSGQAGQGTVRQENPTPLPGLPQT